MAQKIGVPVHSRTKQIIGRSTSQPNDLHNVIAALAALSPNPKIVTTNFDLHLESAFKYHFPSIPFDIYSGPALPVGSRFQGLVHLHGSIEQDPKELILTDSDFGRAYLTEGWARRFLRELFGRFTVLFIGYSHEDTVLTYLARGLPVNASVDRYVLYKNGSNREHWEYLNIIPIPYGEATDLSHGGLLIALQGWVARQSRGAFDERQKIGEILSADPDTILKEDEDLLITSIEDPKTVIFFTSQAKDHKWLVWFSKKGLLQNILNSPRSLSDEEISRVNTLIYWIADVHLDADPESTLLLLTDQSDRINQTLWSALSYGLSKLAARRPLHKQLTPQLSAAWVNFLISTMPPNVSTVSLCDLIGEYNTQEFEDVALILFSRLLTVSLSMTKYDWTIRRPGELSSFEFRTIQLGSSDELEIAWDKVGRKRLEYFAPALLPVVTGQIQNAHLLLRSVGRATTEYDQNSWRRASIEPHPQDKHDFNKDNDILINILRDIIDWFHIHSPDYAYELSMEWANSNIPLLRRLGIYGLKFSNKISSDQKIQWVLTNNLLYVSSAKQEIFSLLAYCYPSASAEARGALLSAALKHEAQIDSEWTCSDKERAIQHRDYEFYNLMHWLSTSDPDCRIASDAVASIKLVHPNFEPRPFPGLTHWSGETTWTQRKSPITAAELEKLTLQQTLDLLKSVRNETAGLDPYVDTWGGLKEVISAVVSGNIDWGCQLAIAIETDNSDELNGIWSALLLGWMKQKRTEFEWRKILEIIRSCKYSIIELIDVTRLFRNVCDSENKNYSKEFINYLFEYSMELWHLSTNDKGLISASDTDWYTASLNHPGGVIAESVCFLCEKSCDSKGLMPNGLGARERLVLIEILRDNRPSGSVGRACLGSRLNVFASWDLLWTLENLAPLFNFQSNPEIAAQVWHGYLYGRVWETALAFMIPNYKHAFLYLRLLSKLREGFAHHLAVITLYSNYDPVGEGWIWDFIEHSDPKDRANFAAHIERLLSAMEDGQDTNVWDKRLKKYFSDRCAAVPKLENSEWDRMVEWSIAVPARFTDIVAAITEYEPPTLKHTKLFYSLKHSELLKLYPTAVASLLAFIIKGARMGEFYATGEVVTLFETLVSYDADSAVLRKMVDELTRLGVRRPEDLLRMIPVAKEPR